MVTRWDVCWADMYFEDSQESKKRPVLILNNRTAYVLAAKMTSKSSREDSDYELIDWKGAGLNKPTVVRLLKHIKFKPSDMLIHIGKLSKVDIDNIKKIVEEQSISLTDSLKERYIMKKENLTESNHKYIITMYQRYPIWEPAEGGYYYDGIEIEGQTEEFDSEEEAKKALVQAAEEEDFEYIRDDIGYAADKEHRKYIGEGKFMQIESDTDNNYDKVGSRVSGYKVYESLKGKCMKKELKESTIFDKIGTNIANARGYNYITYEKVSDDIYGFLFDDGTDEFELEFTEELLKPYGFMSEEETDYEESLNEDTKDSKKIASVVVGYKDESIKTRYRVDIYNDGKSNLYIFDIPREDLMSGFYSNASTREELFKDLLVELGKGEDDIKHIFYWDKNFKFNESLDKNGFSTNLLKKEGTVTSIKENLTEDTKDEYIEYLTNIKGWGEEEAKRFANYFDDYDDLEEAYNGNALSEIVSEMKITGPRNRGGGYPSFNKLYINEKNIPDNMRFKHYDIAETTNNGVYLSYLTQEDFTDDDFNTFVSEVKRAFTESAKNKNYSEPFTLTIDVESRDGNSMGYLEVVINEDNIASNEGESFDSIKDTFDYLDENYDDTEETTYLIRFEESIPHKGWSFLEYYADGESVRDREEATKFTSKEEAEATIKYFETDETSPVPEGAMKVVKIKGTKEKEEQGRSNAEEAFLMGKVMMDMNDEYAYDAFIWLWPDGDIETIDDANYFFGDDEDFEELKDEFIRIYKKFHEGGLYDPDDETVEFAHEVDAKLGLKPIEIIHPKKRVTEGKMKEIDIGIKNAGSKEAYILEVERLIKNLEDERNYLDTQAKNEVGRGGAFDTDIEREEAVEELNKEIKRLYAIITYVLNH